MSVTEEDVHNFLKENEDIAKEWLTNNIGRGTLKKWFTAENTSLSIPGGCLEIRTPDSQSSYVLRRILSHTDRPKPEQDPEQVLKNLNSLSEKEQLLEIIRDISKELDVNVLCHKILINVSVLTDSDTSSLFLVRSQKNTDRQYLVPVIFIGSDKGEIGDSVVKEEDQFQLEFGVGIVGAVAETNETINVKDAYKDPRFNKEVDKRTGYKTRSILCMPIADYEGRLVGVAQIINKKNSDCFSEEDEEVFGNYLSFCGIGLANAQLFEMAMQEYQRNQLLLQLAHNIFEEQSDMHALLQKIMLDARELIRCERCLIYLLEDTRSENKETHVKQQASMKDLASKVKLVSTGPSIEKPEDVCFAKIIELIKDEEENDVFKTLDVLSPSPSNLEHINAKITTIARNVTVSKQVLSVEVGRDPNYDELHTADGYAVKCLLNVPVRDSGHNVIAIIQLINKTSGQQCFTERDFNIVEAFAVFCGLGIHNCQMYESAFKLMAKQSVALEVLSYHATAPQEDTDKLKSAPIPKADYYKLYTWEFDDNLMSDDDTCKATLRMFLECDVITLFGVPYDVLCRWILSVKKNYRPVTYHNWRHAFNVMQTMFTMIFTGKMGKVLTSHENFCLLVACLCHDLDHRGTNNTFQEKSDSALAMLYSSSTMEHHHFDQCIMILNTEGNNIFQRLTPESYREAINTIKNAIISTDLALYFKKKVEFQNLVDQGEKEWATPELRILLRGMLMTACDVAAICKPWEVQQRIAYLVADEFFEQGDLERSHLNLEPMAMMDRKKKDELPKMQVGFIDFICLPVYKTLAALQPALTPLLAGVQSNRSNWQQLADPSTKIETDDDAGTKKQPQTASTSSRFGPLCCCEGTQENGATPGVPQNNTRKKSQTCDIL